MSKIYSVKGQVIDQATGIGIGGVRVDAWDKDLIFDDPVASVIADGFGFFQFSFDESYFRGIFFDRRPDLYFKIYRAQKLIWSTEDSVLWNIDSQLTEVVIKVGAGISGVETKNYTVSGKVSSPDRAGVGGLRVLIVDKNVGQAQDVMLVETTTIPGGHYRAGFTDDSLRERGKAQPDLQVQAYIGTTFLKSSEIRYNAYTATLHETLDVILPANSSALPSEYETLLGAIATQYKGKLSELKETEVQQDITYLANKTGWDARAVALAALADRFSEYHPADAGSTGIAAAFYYALFRVGLPANPETLYQTDISSVERVWKQSIEQGLIPKNLEQEISAATPIFQKLSVEKMLTSSVLVGASSLKDMLATASNLDDNQQKRFAELYTEHQSDMDKFWTEIKAEFPDKVERIKVDGQLGFLTLNNAPLMKLLHTLPAQQDTPLMRSLNAASKKAAANASNSTLLTKLMRSLSSASENELSDPVQLALLGYHRAESWKPLLTTEIPVPKEIPGDTQEAKQTNYAEYLASQIRISYPTAAVAEMVDSQYVKVDIPDQVALFLAEHQGKYEIGVQPIEQYLAKNSATEDAVVDVKTVAQVKRLERVYQITPNDQAMSGLMKNNLDAAYYVVRYDKEAFIQTFGDDLGGAEHAALTYDRSVQVHNVVLNAAVSYLTAKNGLALGSLPLTNPDGAPGASGRILQPIPQSPAIMHSRSMLRDDAAAVADNASDVIAYGTLESLFGEMDFCACDHCRSILSPAAYLVDLLQFIDQPGVAGKSNPQTVFFERRPDIQYMPLTCENTNTALPYIDVVNEMLEYYIANATQKLSLKGYVGHDTNDAKSEDLLASPQFVMDSTYDTAYDTLRSEYFPSPLPFHQPLENLRCYFKKFEVPLPLAMERFRKSDDLERGSNPYGWRDILMEELGLSRTEYDILTDSTNVPLWRMYGLPSATAGDEQVPLSSAKAFTRRLGIRYEDIFAILKTRFVNPNSDLIPKLERLGVPFAVLEALKIGQFPNGNPFTDAEFLALLPQGAGAPDPSNYPDPSNNNGDIVAWVKDEANYLRIMDIITLADSTGDPESDGCSFDTLEFRKSKPMVNSSDISTRLKPVEFVRLLRFIRLWKKTGWTIEQTDAAICALFKSDLTPLEASDIAAVSDLDTGFKTNLLPRLGIVIRVMNALNLTPKRDLLALLACWSDIGTHGDSALYRQMFLNPAVLKQDPAFADNGYGEFLKDTQDSTPKLICHSETLRSAFNLTDQEYSAIFAALGFASEVSVTYQHTNASLEQAILDVSPGIGYDHAGMKLSHRGCFSAEESNALKNVTGITQLFKDAVDALYQASQVSFTKLTLANISAIFRRGWLARTLKLSPREFTLFMQLTGLDPFAAPDLTDPAILQLITFVQKLKDRSLKSEAALYLIWNQDLSGKSAPDAEQLATFGRSLRLDLGAIEAEFAIVDDPDGAIAQAKMSQVYGPDVSAFFFGLLNDTFSTEVEFTDPDGTLTPGTKLDAINAAAGKTNSGEPKITYDNFRKRLAYTGVLSTTIRDAIKQVPGVGVKFGTAMQALYEKNNTAIEPFFTQYAELRPLFNTYVDDVVNSITEKRRRLLIEILPEMIKRRKEQQTLQGISAIAQTDLDFARTLLATTSTVIPLHLHASDHPDQPALNDFLALEKQGLSVQFFASDTVTGTVIPLLNNIAATLDYSPTVNSLPPHPDDITKAISGIWRGLVEAPENGFFTLNIEADNGAVVKLKLDNKDVTLLAVGTVYHNVEPLELRRGSLYTFELMVEKTHDIVRVQWEWEPKGQGRAVIPSRFLYPATHFDAFRKTYIRFLKVAALATALKLTADELAYFSIQPDYTISSDGWLNTLPVIGDPDNATATALLKPFNALLDYARIKDEISADDKSLLSCLKDPMAATAKADGLLFTLARWDRISLSDVLVHFGINTSGLTNFGSFRRIFDAFALIRTMGIPAAALIRATTNEPSGDSVRNFQSALRARYDAATWRDVVKPINDTMRGLQRDALVTYILHQMRANPESAHIDTPDKLFEYFLTDVQMEPCMQTSRIRHALSTVQLFIERCFMNLESDVSPSSLNAKHWEWMKRYRVWEANRKIFLYPENWLEPELRDDKSPFFKEIESELLQSDITEDSAAIALVNYLSKLEEVAKLEPCGIHYVEEKDISHVVARTAGGNRKYYYRRREYGYWTPWETIKLDIEDNPVIPVIWKDRLFLFWLRILIKGPQSAQLPSTGNDSRPLTELTTDNIKAVKTQVTAEAILCWSEYSHNKWQPTKTSDVNKPALLGSFEPNAFDRSALQLRAIEGSDSLTIDISGSGNSSFLLYNTHSLPVRKEDMLPSPIFGVFITASRSLSTSTDIFTIDYARGVWDHWNLPFFPHLSRRVLENKISDRIIEPRHYLNAVWIAPFFYEDSRHVFYVRTTERSVTVSKWNVYGSTVYPKLPDILRVPGLVIVEPTLTIPQNWIDLGGVGYNIGVTDTAPVENYLSIDKYINVAIGTVGNVLYGSEVIGPSGGFFTTGRRG